MDDASDERVSQSPSVRNMVTVTFTRDAFSSDQHRWPDNPEKNLIGRSVPMDVTAKVV